MANKISFKIPLFLEQGVKKKKKFFLNLNNYRNWHFVVSNKLKQQFTDLMRPYMKDLLLQPPIRIHYQLFFSDNRRRDKGNVLSILQKFFLDAAVKHGMLPDDNDNFIEMEIQYQPKKADESYCLVIIEEILDKSKKEDII